MRILAVSHTPIWPIRSGSSVRRLMTLEALDRVGSVDLLFIGETEELISAIPADAPVQRVFGHPIDRRRISPVERARWTLRPTRPLQALEWATSGSPHLPAAYDLVWYFRALPWLLIDGLRAPAVVVDLDDLEDHKLRLARSVSGRRPLRRRIAELRNTTAWADCQRSLAAQVDAVTVCSLEDRHHLAVGNCFVVPNGIPAVPQPAAVRRDPFTVLLVGLFDYAPNADAAEFMAREILPLLRAREPEVELRLVGRPTSRIARLAKPGVTVVGEVPDLAMEYARASVAVAPIRFGGGTRIKIIEAFARRVPVVSTTMGAAGLDVTGGEHLMLCDDAGAFARACEALMNDAPLRRRLVRNAAALQEERYGSAAIGRAVQTVIESVSPPGG